MDDSWRQTRAARPSRAPIQRLQVPQVCVFFLLWSESSNFQYVTHVRADAVRLQCMKRVNAHDQSFVRAAAASRSLTSEALLCASSRDFFGDGSSSLSAPCASRSRSRQTCLDMHAATNVPWPHSEPVCSCVSAFFPFRHLDGA